MRAHFPILTAIAALVVGKVKPDNDGGCHQSVEQTGGFKVSDNYTSFEEFTAFGHTAEHIEGSWEGSGQVLTFKAKFSQQSAEFPTFVVHLTNGRTLGKTNEDFNCRIDSSYVDECPSVKEQPWCCYSAAAFSGHGLLTPFKCSSRRCRDLSPVGLCRAQCMDHLMYHVVFHGNRAEGGGEIKVIASYR